MIFSVNITNMKTKGRKIKIKNKKKNKSVRWKDEVCSPYSKGRAIAPKSCFTRGTILDLKGTYNKYNPGREIQSNKPNEIRSIIQQRLPHCQKESCWVQNVAQPEIKNKLLSLLFAPPQPSEWKNNPKSWLSNFDILAVLKQYEQNFANFLFIGPSAIDYDYRKPDQGMRCVCPKLCEFDLQSVFKQGKQKIGVIFNLDKHYQGGSHWVSLFIDLEEKFIFYFDSTSDPIPNEVKRFIDKVRTQGLDMTPKIGFKYYENRRMEHQMQNNECGMYSLFFIITMLMREKDGKKLDTKQTIEIFLGKRGRISDKQMNEMRDDYFNDSIDSNDSTE